MGGIPIEDTPETRRIREKREAQSLRLENVRAASIKSLREALRDYEDLDRYTPAALGRIVAKSFKIALKENPVLK